MFSLKRQSDGVKIGVGVLLGVVACAFLPASVNPASWVAKLLAAVSGESK